MTTTVEVQPSSELVKMTLVVPPPPPPRPPSQPPTLPPPSTRSSPSSSAVRNNFQHIRPIPQLMLPQVVVDLFSVPEIENSFQVGLGISYVVADYVFLVLITILTRDWQLKLGQAVTITNIQEASKAILIVGYAYHTDSKFGNSRMLASTAINYGIGLLLLFLAYPNFTEQERIQRQTTDFVPKKNMPLQLYFGLAFISIGQCGSFLYGHGDRKEAKDREGNERQSYIINFLKNLVPLYWVDLCVKINWTYVIGLLIAILVFPQVISDRYHLYETLTWMLFGSCALFILGKTLVYNHDKPVGSPLSVFCGVIGLAWSKESTDQNHNTQNNLNSNTNDDVPVEERSQTGQGDKNLTDYLSCLNKAASCHGSIPDGNALRSNGQPYSVKEVEETKMFIRALILSSVFLFYGVMTAVASTFFVEQANSMDRHIKSINVPIQLFVLCSKLTRKIVNQICKLINRTVDASAYDCCGALRIFIGMVLSIPCFLIASIIEEKRLKAVNEDVVISAFWLLPQFIVMGIMDGLALNGMACFFDKEMPRESNRFYGEFLAEGAAGLGKFLSVGFFYAVRNLTKTAYKQGWFGDDLDVSRIDKYYKAMVYVGVISSVIYAVVAVLCYRSKVQTASLRRQPVAASLPSYTTCSGLSALSKVCSGWGRQIKQSS